MIRLRLTLIAFITAIFLAGGYQIKELRADNRDLSAQVEQLAITRQNETLHFGREVERIEELSKLKALQEGFRHDAYQDNSDGGAHVGKSRILRLNQIR